MACGKTRYGVVLMTSTEHSKAIKQLAEAAAKLPNAKVKVKIKSEPKKK